MKFNDVPLRAVPGEVPAPTGRFESFAVRTVDERQKRLAIGSRRLSFGVKFLDAALGGIFPNDLVLLGAKTGRGKTHLATLIAMENAAKGKTVHYFALEAEQDEIERRAKFSLLSEMIRAGCRAVGSWECADRMNYLDWYAGKLEDITAPYEEKVSSALAKKYGTLHTFYREYDFYAEHFEALVQEVQGQTDLIILDHLHYVDSEDSNENRGYKAIVKKVRDVALRAGKPVVVIAHLRKSDRRGTSIIPDVEDFMGTSDVPKMATKAILLAPAFDFDSGDPALWPTYFNPAKCRPDGSRSRYVGRMMFDSRTGKYSDYFDVGTVAPGGDKFELADVRKLPRWAKE
jgi:hypothetical protein